MFISDGGIDSRLFRRRASPERERKKRLMKKTVCLLLTVMLILGLALPASAAETSYPTIESGVQEIQKHGNLVLDMEPEKLQEAGYDYGDMLCLLYTSPSPRDRG